MRRMTRSQVRTPETAISTSDGVDEQCGLDR